MVSLRWPRRGLDTRQRVAAIAAVVMVALLLVSASPPRVRGVSPDALAEATRFRSEFGLDDDPANVAAMAANSDPSMAWGVPLTVAEETLMNVRAGVPAELAELRDYRKAHWATWGGMWLSYPRGLPAGKVVQIGIGVTEDPKGSQSALMAIVPPDAVLSVVRVERSEADLDELADRVAHDQDFFAALGATYYSAATLSSENIVEIDVDIVTDRLTAMTDLRYGIGTVRLEPGGPVQADTCSRGLGTIPPNPTSHCGPPWKGGLAIFPPSGLYCTSGFVVRKWLPQYVEWIYAIWTAGHCGNHAWREGSISGTLIGTTVSNYFADNSAADVQVIPINEADKSNYYLDTTSSCSSACHVSTIIAKEGYNTDEQGDPVCNHGAVSGTKCGIINSTNVPLSYDGADLVRLRRATYARQPGDSGGPVTLGSSDAEGSHVHYKFVNGITYAYYSQVWEMESASGYSVYFGN
jgi:hypothetical protein